MLISLDGPAGAGKGTLGRHLAELYNLDFLDTGLLFRAVGYKLIQNHGTDFIEEQAIDAASSITSQDLENPSLREEEIGNIASKIATITQVRSLLLKFQRDFAAHHNPEKQGVILDGRDIGTVVFPNAPCKIFVTASQEVRAKRRLKELQDKQINSIYKDVLGDIKIRDLRDETRRISPLGPAKDALILDTSELSINDVVAEACKFIDSKFPNAHKLAPSF